MKNKTLTFFIITIFILSVITMIGLASAKDEPVKGGGDACSKYDGYACTKDFTIDEWCRGLERKNIKK